MSPRGTRSRSGMIKLCVALLLSTAGFLIVTTTSLDSSAKTIVAARQAPQDDYFAYLPFVANNYCANGFFDDFSDTASGWYTGDDGNIRWQYMNGQYRIEIYHDSWWTGAPATIHVNGDYTLQVDASNLGSYGPYGLMFDLADDWSEFYALVVHTDSYFQVLHYDTSQPNSWAVLASGNPLLNSWEYQLRVERATSQAKVYINNQYITTITNLALAGEKRVGVYVSSFLPGYPTYMDARFDNFKLCGQVSPLARQATGADLSQALRLADTIR